MDPCGSPANAPLSVNLSICDALSFESLELETWEFDSPIHYTAACHHPEWTHSDGEGMSDMLRIGMRNVRSLSGSRRSQGVPPGREYRCKQCCYVSVLNVLLLQALCVKCTSVCNFQTKEVKNSLDRGSMGGGRSYTVSYTHLTLPTIYSV